MGSGFENHKIIGKIIGNITCQSAFNLKSGKTLLWSGVDTPIKVPSR